MDVEKEAQEIYVLCHNNPPESPLIVERIRALVDKAFVEGVDQGLMVTRPGESINFGLLQKLRDEVLEEAAKAIEDAAAECAVTPVDLAAIVRALKEPKK